MFKKFINCIRRQFKLFEIKLIFLEIFNYATICFAIFAKDSNNFVYTILLFISVAITYNLFINLGRTIDKHNEFITNYYNLVEKLVSNDQTTITGSYLSKPTNLIDLHNYKDSDDKCHAIICDNYKDAYDCCKFLDSQGYRWLAGNSYLESNCYSIDYKYICYLFNKGTYLRCNDLSELNITTLDLHYWTNLHNSNEDNNQV